MWAPRRSREGYRRAAAHEVRVPGQAARPVPRLGDLEAERVTTARGDLVRAQVEPGPTQCSPAREAASGHTRLAGDGPRCEAGHDTMGIVDPPLLPRHQKNSTGAAIAATPQQEITLFYASGRQVRSIRRRRRLEGRRREASG